MQSNPIKRRPQKLATIMMVSLMVFCTQLSAGMLNDSTAAADSAAHLKAGATKLYMDCPSCDMDYLRTEVTFVNFVRDRMDAQVHVLVTTAGTGSGGTEYTLSFIGGKEFSGVNDTLTFSTEPGATKEKVRKDMARVMKLGLIRYAARGPLSHNLSVDFSLPTSAAAAKDNWDYWVFNVSTDGYLNGQSAYTSTSMWGNFSANRVTADMKVNLSLYGDYSEDRYQVDDTTEYLSVSRGKGMSASVTMSMGDHWSWQLSSNASTSTYSNSNLAMKFSPALEYSLFPYSESTRKLYRINYRPSFKTVKYADTTIYGKINEQLFGESLNLGVDFTEPWGSSSISIQGFHYFHDFTKYELTLYGSIRIRLIEGLSIRVQGNFAKIHDQLGLPAAGASQEEILLRQRELETSYRYWVNFGFSYSIGSIFNNIVNPRFGNDD